MPNSNAIVAMLLAGELNPDDVRVIDGVPYANEDGVPQEINQEFIENHHNVVNNNYDMRETDVDVINDVDLNDNFFGIEDSVVEIGNIVM